MKQHNSWLPFIVIVLTILSTIGCSPSEETLQVALAQTQTAMATNTHTPEPTATFTPEPTFTPSSTNTLTLTNTPTPTQTFTPTPDLRIITIEPKEFLLSKEDLPTEANYSLSGEDFISQIPNSAIINSWDREEGIIYIEETGRIDGWEVAYSRGSRTERAPEELYHNIIQYISEEGAYLTLTKYNRQETSPEYSLLNIKLDLGEITYIFARKMMQPNGEYRVSYIIETQYRNYVSIIGGWGWEEDFDLDYVISVAETILVKLEAAPLGNW